jgi:uncharacterized membrane protein
MANMLIPVEERNLTPEEVTALDRRRRRGHLLLVIGWQTAIVSVLLTLWSGQDLTYSPGWNHWMFYWNCVTALTSLTCFARGLQLRRGLNEFFSY